MNNTIRKQAFDQLKDDDGYYGHWGKNCCSIHSASEYPLKRFEIIQSTTVIEIL